MNIGKRLRTLREEKKLSQADIEKKTGLLRCYVSRVENGHTIPSLATLEKFAGALDAPLCRLFYEGDGEPAPPKLGPVVKAEEEKDPLMGKLRRLVSKMDNRSQQLLLYTLQKMAARQGQTDISLP